MLSAAAAPEPSTLCTTCFRSKQTLAPVRSGRLATTESHPFDSLSSVYVRGLIRRLRKRPVIVPTFGVEIDFVVFKDAKRLFRRHRTKRCSTIQIVWSMVESSPWDIEPLFANPVLPLVALASADPAFQEALQVPGLLSYFNRSRLLDPPRDQLPSSLFLYVPPRTVQGRGALQDMFEQNQPVAYRPSLGPEIGHCRVPQHARIQSPQAA